MKKKLILHAQSNSGFIKFIQPHMSSIHFTKVSGIVWIIFLAIISFSCVPQRKMMYLQVENQQDTLTQFENERTLSYLVQPGDNLYIKVVSLDERTATLFNPLENLRGGSNVNDQSIYLTSYMVNDKGNIDFPMAGQIYVQNLTTEQIKDKIQEVLNQYLKETLLIVKLVNFNVTILGEVKHPGQFKVYKPEINVFEAIAMAGDLTDFANRKEVTIIRQTKTGSETIPIDLERRNVLGSDHYYLRPNDMIYVKPLKIKQYGFATFPYALIFSTISTALLLINFFK